jgi:serine/threonine protein kinase
MKRGMLQLDASAVEDSQAEVNSVEFRTDNALQLRAFLFRNGSIYTSDGRRELGVVNFNDVDWEKKRFIGRGSSGTVMFATLKSSNKPIALKHIPINSKPHRDELERELIVFSSMVDNPFVMKNLGAFWEPEENAILLPMEWMAFTLGDLSGFWEGLEESILRDVFFQVVSGLRYLHDAKRLIHRDLKPSNILVSEDGYVKIGDFGVSKLVQTLDVSSTYVGTMQYMAPERLEQGSYTFSSDIWSLGLTIIGTVTGKNPWGEELNLFGLLQKLAGDGVPQLPEGKYSEEARDLTRQCLSRDPELRPTCADLLGHPFFRGCTEEGCVRSVREVVEHMTRLINQDAKKQERVQKKSEELEALRNSRMHRLDQAVK